MTTFKHNFLTFSSLCVVDGHSEWSKSSTTVQPCFDKPDLPPPTPTSNGFLQYFQWLGTRNLHCNTKFKKKTVCSTKLSILKCDKQKKVDWYKRRHANASDWIVPLWSECVIKGCTNQKRMKMIGLGYRIFFFLVTKSRYFFFFFIIVYNILLSIS